MKNLIARNVLGLALVVLWSTTVAGRSLRHPFNELSLDRENRPSETVDLSWIKKPLRRTYNKPYYKGYRLDWCNTWANDCGTKAADAYCRYRGYRKAYDIRKDDNIGSTKLIGTGQRCTHPNCDGFKYITCTDPRYDKPLYRGHRLDYCYCHGARCGKIAANAFCKYVAGLTWAPEFEIDHDVGAQTTEIGSADGDCHGSYCDSFKYIYCAGWLS